MGDMSRRRFITSSSALAAGTVVGGLGISTGKKALRGYLSHGPVEFRMRVFTEEPYPLKGSLFSDDRKNLFGIKVDFGGWGTTTAKLPLEAVKRALRNGRASHLTLEICGDGNKKGAIQINASVEGDQFVLREDDKGDAPFWISLRDIHKVVG